MNEDFRSDFILRNQTMVRFQIGDAQGVAYSNILDTPWVGPILRMVKGLSEQQVTLNQPFTVSFTITNDGNRDAQLTLFDTLPEGLAYIPNSTIVNGAPLPGADPIAGIDVGPVHSLSSVQVVFQAILVSIPASLQLTNTGSAFYSFQSLEGRTVTGTILSNEVVLSVLPYYVSIVAEVSTSQTFAGDVIMYTLTIMNLGNVALTNLVVFIPLPPGIIFVAGSVMIGDIYFPSIGPQNGIPVGTLSPGMSIVIKVRLRVGQMTGSNTFTLQGIVSYDMNTDPIRDPANELLVTVIQPDITISKSVDKKRALPGCTLQYSSVIQNVGGFAVEASFKDILPPEIEFVPGSLKVNNRNHEDAKPRDGLFLGTIRPGMNAEVTFEAFVCKITGCDPVSANNQAAAPFTFRLPDGRVVQQTSLSEHASVEVFAPDIQITAIPAHYVVEPGETLSFHITVTNQGSWAAEVKMLGWIQNKPVFNQGTVTMNEHPVTFNHGFELGSLSPSQSIVIVYTTRVGTDLHHNTEEVTGSFLFAFHSVMDDCTYDGEADSANLTIFVDAGEE